MINIINSRGNSISTIIIIPKKKKNSNKIKNIVNNKENCITTIIITLHTSARVPEEGRKRNRLKIICYFRLTRLVCAILGTSTSTKDSPEK